MNVHDAPAEGNFCVEQGKAIKPLTVTESHHTGCVDDTRWPTAIPLPSHLEVDKDIVLPSVRSGHSDHLYSSLLLWYKGNLSHRF
jgi:hypothetical protein